MCIHHLNQTTVMLNAAGTVKGQYYCVHHSLALTVFLSRNNTKLMRRASPYLLQCNMQFSVCFFVVFFSLSFCVPHICVLPLHAFHQDFSIEV